MLGLLAECLYAPCRHRAAAACASSLWQCAMGCLQRKQGSISGHALHAAILELPEAIKGRTAGLRAWKHDAAGRHLLGVSRGLDLEVIFMVTRRPVPM